MAGKSVKSDSGNADVDMGDAGERERENTSNGGETVIDPASILGGNTGDDFERDGDGNLVYGASGKPRKKRGRKSGGNIAGAGKAGKSGSGNNKTLKDGVDTLSKTLLVLHMGISSYAKFDGFMINDKEADALSASIVNVMDQFDWAPDPRLVAVAGLVSTSATIYGPRIYLYREHLKEKAKEKRDKAATVVDMTGFANAH